jgi:hypothetical protein
MLQQDDIWDLLAEMMSGTTGSTAGSTPSRKRCLRPLGMCARTQEKTTMADEYGRLTDAQIVALTALAEGATITAAAEAANVARVAANRPLKPTNRSGHSVHYQTNINDDIEGRQ